MINKGDVFGRWVVLGLRGKNKWNKNMWECLCQCGTERVVEQGNLIGGHSKSCGCIGKERIVKRNKERSKKSK